jgi:hypothetical protein
MKARVHTYGMSVLAVFMLASAPAEAAIISWSQPVTITSEEVIQANVSSAFNISPTASTLAVTTTTQTVNFVGGNSYARTSNGITLTLINANPGFMNAGIGPVAGAWVGSHTDPDFSAIMNTFAHTRVTNPSNGTFTLSGLEIGQQYSVQLLVSDMRAGIGDIRSIRFDDGLGNFTDWALESSAPSFIGTFTANSTSQSFGVFSQATSGDSGSVLNAVTISLVPEPSTALLGGLGIGLGMCLLLRSRR